MNTKPITIPIHVQPMTWCLFAPETATGLEGSSPGLDETVSSVDLGTSASLVGTALVVRVIEADS